MVGEDGFLIGSFAALRTAA